MLDGVDADLDRAKAMGISLFAGEAEGRLDEVLRDAAAGTLKPLYNYMDDLPGIEGTPIPLMAVERAQRTAGGTTSFDAGRGCPYQCSFCTIINVQGRKSRRRSPDDVEKIVRVNYAQGLRAFFITDDNFARNKDWEPILDRLIHLREVEKFNISFIIQVDTLCHKLPNFIEKCARAGVKRVFIGLENINPDNLAGRQEDARTRSPNTARCCWPGRTPASSPMPATSSASRTTRVESIMHDIDVIKRELPVDLLEFFYLTPLPGSEDHLKLFKAGAPLDPDLNKYDLNHICTTHPKMSREEWDRAYKMAWQRYYTIDHVETILRRVAATRANASNALFLITWFMGSINIEHIHPLEGGFLRRRSRAATGGRGCRSSRSGRSIRNISPRSPGKLVRWAALYLKLRRIYLRIKHDPQRFEYTDMAMTPVAADEAETHELFGTDAARAYVAQAKRVKQAQDGHAHEAMAAEAAE